MSKQNFATVIFLAVCAMAVPAAHAGNALEELAKEGGEAIREIRKEISDRKAEIEAEREAREDKKAEERRKHEEERERRKREKEKEKEKAKADAKNHHSDKLPMKSLCGFELGSDYKRNYNDKRVDISEELNRNIKLRQPFRQFKSGTISFAPKSRKLYRIELKTVVDPKRSGGDIMQELETIVKIFEEKYKIDFEITDRSEGYRSGRYAYGEYGMVKDHHDSDSHHKDSRHHTEEPKKYTRMQFFVAKFSAKDGRVSIIGENEIRKNTGLKAAGKSAEKTVEVLRIVVERRDLEKAVNPVNIDREGADVL